MDRWKFVNEKWIPRPVSRGEGYVLGIAVLSYRSLPHRGRGAASAVDRVLSYIACLRRSPSLSFIPLEPYPARSARHLPHAGKALSVDIVFPHISCIRSDNARKAVSSYRSLPHWGNAVKLSKILIAHASNSVCFFHVLSLLVNNKIKKLVK